MAHLTVKRIEAIQRALAAYLAGEPMEDDPSPRKDYEAALRWAQEQRAKRTPYARP